MRARSGSIDPHATVHDWVARKHGVKTQADVDADMRALQRGGGAAGGERIPDTEVTPHNLTVHGKLAVSTVTPRIELAAGPSGNFVNIRAGDGRPEGVASGGAADLYLRTNATTIAYPFFKESTLSNVDGWIPMDGFVRARRESAAQANPGATTISAMGMSAWTTVGTLANADDDGHCWLRSTTAAVNGSVAQFVGPGVTRLGWGPGSEPVEAVFHIRGGIIDVSRFWCGLADGDPSGSSTPALNFAMFRYVAGTDTDFRIYTGDGTNRTQTGSGVSFSNNQEVRFRITLEPTKVRFFIDHAFVGEITTTLPTASALLSPYLSLTTLEGVAKSVLFDYARFLTT